MSEKTLEDTNLVDAVDDAESRMMTVEIQALTLFCFQEEDGVSYVNQVRISCGPCATPPHELPQLLVERVTMSTSIRSSIES